MCGRQSINDSHLDVSFSPLSFLSLKSIFKKRKKKAVGLIQVGVQEDNGDFEKLN